MCADFAPARLRTQTQNPPGSSHKGPILINLLLYWCRVSLAEESVRGRRGGREEEEGGRRGDHQRGGGGFTLAISWAQGGEGERHGEIKVEGNGIDKCVLHRKGLTSAHTFYWRRHNSPWDNEQRHEKCEPSLVALFICYAAVHLHSLHPVAYYRHLTRGWTAGALWVAGAGRRACGKQTAGGGLSVMTAASPA